MTLTCRIEARLTTLATYIFSIEKTRTIESHDETEQTKRERETVPYEQHKHTRSDRTPQWRTHHFFSSIPGLRKETRVRRIFSVRVPLERERIEREREREREKSQTDL